MISDSTSSASLSERSVRSANFAMASLIMMGADNPMRLEFQEISEQVFPGLGQNRFRMKLHALDRERPMPQPHNFAFGGLGRNLQTVGKILGIHQQRVIACRLEWIRQS